MSTTKKTINNVYYRNLPAGVKRKELRELIVKATALRRKQIKLFEDMFIVPQRKIIDDAQAVLRNEVPIERFLIRERKWNEFISKYLETTNKGEQK